MAFSASNINESNLGSDLASKINRVVLNYTIGIVDNDTYPILLYLPTEIEFDTIYYKTASGTCSLNVRLESTSITGWSALSASSSEGNASATGANMGTTGQTLSVVVSSNSSAEMLSLTIIGQEL